MAKKTIKKSSTAKSKKNPKIGTSKKTKTGKASKVKKQAARSKARSTANKINKAKVESKKAKAKKNMTELKKPKTGSLRKSETKKVSKKKPAGKAQSKKVASKKASSKKPSKKSIPSKAVNINKKLKQVKKTKQQRSEGNSTPTLTQQQISENALRAKIANEQEKDSAFQQDPTHAPGKKHISLVDATSPYGNIVEANGRNEIARPEAYGKRGRSSSPRAPFTNR